MNTLPVLAVGRARNLGLTPGRGAFVGRDLDGEKEHAEATRCHFVPVNVIFVHSTRLVNAVGPMQAGSQQRAAPAWLRQCVVGSDDKRRACDDHGLNGERAILAAD